MVLTISSEIELDNFLKQSSNNFQLLIVDFFTTWCGPCLQFSPEFERMSTEFKDVAIFIKVDCEKTQNLAYRFKIKILPTVKGYFNMQEAFSLSGSGVSKVPEEIRENIILPSLKMLSLKNPSYRPLRFLLKITENIINNPTDGKYRLLKLTNTAVQRNLLAFEGVKEFLLSMGFVEDNEQLVMEQPTSLEPCKQFRKQLVMLIATKEKPGEQSENSSDRFSKSVASSNVLNSNAFHESGRASVHTKLDVKATEFMNTLKNLQNTINRYENIDLMNIVSVLVDMDSFKSSSLNQETVLKKLLRWFKYDFFSWFKPPVCFTCKKPYISAQSDFPTSEESQWLASIVELYKCETCYATSRFPRYNHPEKLLITRTGRCGEWANCFCMILRTFINEGIFERARFVKDWSDHVWCEVFMKLNGESESRWVHVDPCEGTYDAPLTYQIGWNKKIDYVMGVSLITGDIQDITWRYTNDFRKTMSDRQLINEEILVNKLLEFHRTAGTDFKLIIKELVSFLPSKNKKTEISEKEMMGRTTGSEEWRLERGELGNQPIWKKKFIGPSIRPTALELLNNCVHIQYNCSVDAYHRPFDTDPKNLISGDNDKSSSSGSVSSSELRKSSSVNKSRKDLLSHDTEGWQSLAATWLNIQRKVEYDWEVVYLARMNNSSPEAPGEISWTVDLAGTNKRIKEISIFASSAEFHSATVKWTLHSGDCSIPINGFVTTTKFNHCSVVTLTALLQSGVSDTGANSWQHSQLCRQKSTDFDVKTLQIKIELCDS